MFLSFSEQIQPNVGHVSGVTGVMDIFTTAGHAEDVTYD